jgi:hypothetical protein
MNQWNISKKVCKVWWVAQLECYRFLEYNVENCNKFWFAHDDDGLKALHIWMAM